MRMMVRQLREDVCSVDVKDQPSLWLMNAVSRRSQHDRSSRYDGRTASKRNELIQNLRRRKRFLRAEELCWQ
jgi:hypothetical protein